MHPPGLWAAALILTGLLAGAAWATVGSLFGRVLLIVAFGLIGLSVWRSRRTRSKADRVED